MMLFEEKFDMSKFIKVLEWANKNYPNHRILDSFSPNQMSSKKWLIDELSDIDGIDGPWSLPNGKWDNEGNSIEIVGSWYGFPLIYMLWDALEIRDIKCWDIDFEARQIAEYYNSIFKFNDLVEIYSQDYFNHERGGSRAHILINTSSEHMTDTFADMDERFGVEREHLGGAKNFYVKNPFVCIQSNNMKHIPEHVNCVESTDELINKHKINQILYQGYRNILEWDGTEIKKTLGRYKRFMVIGKL